VLSSLCVYHPDLGCVLFTLRPEQRSPLASLADHGRQPTVYAAFLAGVFRWIGPIETIRLLSCVFSPADRLAGSSTVSLLLAIQLCFTSGNVGCPIGTGLTVGRRRGLTRVSHVASSAISVYRGVKVLVWTMANHFS